MRLTTATSGTVVTIDGEVVKPPVEYLVNPGEHEVIAKRDDKIVYERRVTLPESAAVEVEIDAPLAAAGPSAKPVPVPTPEERPKTPSRISATPFFIGGGALVAASFVSFVFAKSAQNDVEANCATQTTHGCDTGAAGASRVGTWETIGWIAGGAAVVSVGVGFVLLGRNDDKPHASASIRPLIGSTTGISFEGSF